MKKLFIVSIYIFFLNTHISAQDSTDTISAKNYSPVIWTKNFSIDIPASGFVKSPEGDGFVNNAIKASIKILPMPVDFKKMRKDFDKFVPSDTRLFIDSIKHIVNNREAFTLITEEVSTNKKFGNYITMMTILDIEEGVVMVVGAYPKTHDKMLRDGYLRSSLSVKIQ